MIIRKAKKSEGNIIAEIHIESWRDSYADVFPPDLLDRKIVPSLKEHWSTVEIKDNDVVLVAEEKEVIGFIAVWCRPIPFIDNLHVKPSHRSQNVGTALMKAAAEALLLKGNRTGYLWVFHNNEKAIGFYERLGGVQKECAVKDIFGHGVLSKKIEWDDLSTITMEQDV
jgi:ribosomal protein S18 acetylase RimI-like enzyme